MIIIIIFDLFLYFKIDNNNYENNNKQSEIILEENKVTENVSTKKVEIKGMVNNPGVYECKEDDRVIDVINKANGLVEGANTDLINLSMKVTDEMVIIIYSNDFINNYKENNKKIEYVYVEVESCPDQINDACINNNTDTNQITNETSILNEETEKTTNTSDNKISINSATIEELKSLSGIGDSKAKAIINYREENGNFKSIDEIKNVSGIGDSMFEKIKDNITI